MVILSQKINTVVPNKCPSIRTSVRPFTPLNDLSSETPGPNFIKLHVEPCVKGGLKICTNGHGPLIKMAGMPIYKNVQIDLQMYNGVNLKNLYE